MKPLKVMVGDWKDTCAINLICVAYPYIANDQVEEVETTAGVRHTDTSITQKLTKLINGIGVYVAGGHEANKGSWAYREFHPHIGEVEHGPWVGEAITVTEDTLIPFLEKWCEVDVPLDQIV